MSEVITLASAEAKLTEWMAAETAIASGAQSYQISTGAGYRIVTRANIDEVADRISYWSRKVAELKRAAAGKPRTGYKLASFR